MFEIMLNLNNIYNTINILPSGDLTAGVLGDIKSCECNRFFVTYIATRDIYMRRNRYGSSNIY